MSVEDKDKTVELKYDFKQIEEKWQKRWEETKLFQAPERIGDREKFYMLVMFACWQMTWLSLIVIQGKERIYSP